MMVQDNKLNPDNANDPVSDSNEKGNMFLDDDEVSRCDDLGETTVWGHESFRNIPNRLEETQSFQTENQDILDDDGTFLGIGGTILEDTPSDSGYDRIESDISSSSSYSSKQDKEDSIDIQTKDVDLDHTEKNNPLSSGSVHKNPSNAPSLLTSSITLGNQYRLLERAGKGKMGEVWKAYDIIGNRVVALKFIPRNIEGYKYAVLKAKSTFLATHDLNHQYICPTHSLLEDPDFGYFLVMKWIPDNLKNTIEENSVDGIPAVLPKPIIRSILFNLADALDFLHAHHVIHRDIKPANIAVIRKSDESFDSISLIDFGLAVSLDYKGLADGFYQLSGTPSYMSPEQWKNEKQGPPSDQYSFAVVAYELISGHRVFSAKSIPELEAHVLYTTPNPIEDISARINNALLKALSKKPEDRFSTCREFVETMFPPKQTFHFWKSLTFWGILLAVVFLTILFSFSLEKKPTIEKQKGLQLYHFVVKPNEKDPLGFMLEKSCQVIPKVPLTEIPPISQDQRVVIDQKDFAPDQDQNEKNWTWTWSKEKRSGTLVLKNYKGGPIRVCGITMDLVLPPDSNNSITAPQKDALFVDGDLTIRADRRSSLSLNGGLWCRNRFSFVDSRTDQKNDKPEDPPALIIQGKKIDYFVDTFEKLSAVLHKNENHKTILVTNSMESGPVDGNITDELAGITIPISHRITLLSSGNHLIKKGKKTAVQYPLLQVNGSLTLGFQNGMGSSTLTFDGGSVFDKDHRTDYPHIYSIKMTCDTLGGKKSYRFFPHILDQTSKIALVTVQGDLVFHQGIFFQNNININYFSKLNTHVSSGKSYVGGIFVDKMGSLEMTGGSIRGCQGALCGAINACGQLIMSGGRIENNCAYNGGNNIVESAGIRVFNTIFNMSGGEIINNFALANPASVNTDICAKGGGIHGSWGSIISISGGSIRGNISLWAGGGIYMGGKGNSKLVLSNDVLISDNAAVLGGGIYTSSNIFMKDGVITNNQLLRKISSMSPRGEGIYIKEWNSPDTQGQGPVLTLSGNAFIDPNNPVFICSNVAVGPYQGPCVFIPIKVNGLLTNIKQKFMINMGSAVPTTDSTIRLIQMNGKDFNTKIDDLSSQFNKFQFGYLGFFENTAFKFDILPEKNYKRERKNGSSTMDLPYYYLVLKDDPLKQ